MACYKWKSAPTYKGISKVIKPRKLCNIETQIVEWQGANNKIPKKYEIYVSCGCKDDRCWDTFWAMIGFPKCRKKKFVIVQPLSAPQRPLFESDNPWRDDFIDRLSALIIFVGVVMMYWRSVTR